MTTPKAQLDRFGQRFWSLTHFMLDARPSFDDGALAFELLESVQCSGFSVQAAGGCAVPPGRYHLISKNARRSPAAADGDDAEERSQYLYRLSHPLGEYVVDSAKAIATPPVRIVFDVSHHPTRIHAVEALRGKRGFLTLTRLVVESYEREEYLLFSGRRMELLSLGRPRPTGLGIVSLLSLEVDRKRELLDRASAEVALATK